MADIIRLLPDHVANQIAAGEVVQRPASVVKELLENAIDAKAETIKLMVKDGGKTLIQVVDDGIGMSATDARLSFERHATSKIERAEDLFSLGTKGFRGEALASIAAIAHVDMQTRPGHDELGTHIRIEGSKLLFQEVCATPKGTSLSVKNLFFNIPARRNFLKSNTVELRHITDEFHRVALAHPDIAFYFYSNGSELFNLPKANLRQRIVHIFGSKTNAKLVPVTEETQVVSISGFILKPKFAKKGRGQQFFFVNDRYIKCPYLHHAVGAAFEGLIKSDSHPGYFLYLTVDPASIDINIHPTKTEVKFDDEHTLYAILRSAIKHSLGQFNVMPALDFDLDTKLNTPYAEIHKAVHPPKVTVDADFNPFAEAGTGKAQTYRRPTTSRDWESIYVGLGSAMQGDDDRGSLQFESDGITGSVFPDSEAEAQSTVTFQLRRKYIVTTIKSGMIIIDQNRAHQRVLYEKFLGNSTLQEISSQQLLFPLVVSFSRGERTILDELRTDLAGVGFIYEEFDSESVRVTGVPPLVPESEVGSVLERLITEYGGESMGKGFSQADVLSKTLSRTLAVKPGDVLDNASQLALVNDLFACKEVLVSPFNKPIYVTITESDIDKKFV